jgi:dihydrofolate reductase
MRKVIESTLVSLDSVIGDPMTWANGYFGKQAQEVALAQLQVSDAMLMGRHTYEMFAAASDAGTDAYSERMKSIRKYVFSSTLQRADWNNSVIIRGNVAEAVARLKQEEGQDLVFYGHGPLGQSLLEHHLLDELRLWIHPLLLGSGTLLFRQGEKTALKLVSTRTIENGVVILTYQPDAARSGLSKETL